MGLSHWQKSFQKYHSEDKSKLAQKYHAAIFICLEQGATEAAIPARI